MQSNCTTPLKCCTRCKEQKPKTLEYFRKRSDSKDGLHNICHVCHRKKSREWELANPERTAELNRKKAARQREKKRQLMLDRTQAWRSNNKEKIKEYRQKNSDKFAVYSMNRRDRERGVINSFTHDQWQSALDYFNGRCAVCERQLNGLFHTAAMDHWIPISDTDCPGTIPSNIIPLCHGVGGCNNSKRDNAPEEWLIKKFGIKKAKTIGNRIHKYFSIVSDKN